MQIEPEPTTLRLLRLVFPVMTGLLFLLLAWVLLPEPVSDPVPAARVMAALPESGVNNPVTAVLLNFRAFDTLLELGVLLLAVIGVWSLQAMPATRTAPPPDPIQLTLTWVLLPLMIVIAAYLVWIGAKEPGGAFQAGAILAAAGVMLLLAGRNIFALYPIRLYRFLLPLGVTVFLLTGMAPLARSGLFLSYPPEMAGQLILLIEICAAVSNGLALTGLVAGGRPGEANHGS